MLQKEGYEYFLGYHQESSMKAILEFKWPATEPNVMIMQGITKLVNTQTKRQA